WQSGRDSASPATHAGLQRRVSRCRPGPDREYHLDGTPLPERTGMFVGSAVSAVPGTGSRVDRYDSGMALTNPQILLVSRPEGEPSIDNFQQVEVPVSELVEGQVLVRNHFLSI